MAKYNSCTSLTLNSIDATCGESRASIKRVLVCPKEVVEIYKQSERIVQIFPLAYAHKTIPYPQDYRTDPFVEYRFRRNTGSYTSTYTGDNTTGSQVVTTEVSLQFSKAENQKRLEFQKLTGRPCVMIIEDNYGQYIALGVDAPIVLTNTVMQSGTAKSDLSGFTLTFTEESNVFPPFIQEDFDINGLLISRETTKLFIPGPDFYEDYFDGTPEQTITSGRTFGGVLSTYLQSPRPYIGIGSLYLSDESPLPYKGTNSFKKKVLLNGNTFSIDATDNLNNRVSLIYKLKNDAFTNTPLYVTVEYTITFTTAGGPWAVVLTVDGMSCVA